jgi:drug/metabolite transporter (DMT)-like permease
MSGVAWSLILAGVALNAAAQLFLKAGTNAVGQFEFSLANAVPVGTKLAFQPFILAGMACYAVSLVVWIMGLSRAPVSVAYPMLSLGYVVNAIVAWAWLGEAVTPLRLVGIGIIVLGVYIVARS